MAQQHTQCGTAPDRYGDLIAVLSPIDANLPMQHLRMAAAYSDAGEFSAPSGIDALRANSGTALRLEFRPTLQLNLIDQRWLIVTSKDGGSAVVFEVPTMKRAYVVKQLENSSDISSVSMTTDHRTSCAIEPQRIPYLLRFRDRNASPSRTILDEELVLLDLR